MFRFIRFDTTEFELKEAFSNVSIVRLAELGDKAVEIRARGQVSLVNRARLQKIEPLQTPLHFRNLNRNALHVARQQQHGAIKLPVRACGTNI